MALKRLKIVTFVSVSISKDFFAPKAEYFLVFFKTVKNIAKLCETADLNEPHNT